MDEVVVRHEVIDHWREKFKRITESFVKEMKEAGASWFEIHGAIELSDEDLDEITSEESVDA
jgi:hypothetical protein